MRNDSSTRRDVLVVFGCFLTLLLLVEFRYDVSSRLLVRIDKSYSASPPPTSSDGTVVLDLSAELDDYGEPVMAKPVSPGRKHRGSHRHKSTAKASPTRPSTYDTGDSNVGQQKVQWGRNGDVPLTSVLRHSPGYTILDNVYSLNGTLYLVQPTDSDHGAIFPDVRTMITNADPEPESTDPTDEQIKIVDTFQARKMFGNHASRVAGTSFISYGDVEVFGDYYHFSAEVLFNLWRTYASLDLAIPATGHTKLAQPRRLIAPHVSHKMWRDYANLNQYVMRSAFPSTGLEFASDWADRAETLQPFVFDRIVLADRNVPGADKRVDEIPKSPHWWSPVRNNVLSFSGVNPRLEKNPVITYVTMQGRGRRMMKPTDHERLVKALQKLRKSTGWEVNVIEMEDLTRVELIRLAGRTTVMMGVHGAGLTSLVWMRPDPRSTVIEFLPPNTYNNAFEYTARTLDIKHYAFWNDKPMTHPDLPNQSNLPGRGMPLDSDSDEIPVDAGSVILLVKQRVQQQQH